MSIFHGLSAFPLTPTGRNGAFAPDAQRRILQRLVDARVDSIGLLGSTGGYAYLSLAERQAILDLALDQVAGAVPLIVGVGAIRTDMAVALARHAAQAGADGLLLAPVSYTPLTEDEVFTHYASVADAGGLPLCIYHNPSTTHFTFSPALIARLGALPHVASVKMPLPASGDFEGEIAALRAVLPANFAIGYSGDWGCAAAMLAGADGWFSVVAGLLPEPTLRLARVAKAGDAAQVATINADFEPLWDLFRQFGSFRVVHAAAGLMGIADSAPPRPILPLADSETSRLRQALERLGAL